MILTIFQALLSLISVVLFYQNQTFLFILLLLLATSMLLNKIRTYEFILFASCSLAGALAEVFAIKFGAWFYPITFILNIPVWLAPLWGIAALFVFRIGLNLREKINY